MPDEARAAADPLRLRQRALSRWDNEGGASRRGREENAINGNAELTDIPLLSNAEVVHLRIRVIALENLMIALFAEASDRQIAVAREMAAFVAPRPGFTHHPLTIHAACHMIDLIERAAPFRSAGRDERSSIGEAQPDG
jgi:hypothetical protein